MLEFVAIRQNLKFRFSNIEPSCFAQVYLKSPKQKILFTTFPEMPVRGGGGIVHLAVIEDLTYQSRL